MEIGDRVRMGKSEFLVLEKTESAALLECVKPAPGSGWEIQIKMAGLTRVWAANADIEEVIEERGMADMRSIERATHAMADVLTAAGYRVERVPYESGDTAFLGATDPETGTPISIQVSVTQ
jgi:hypothetical protein